MNDHSESLSTRIERAVLLATHGRVGRLHINLCGDEIVLYGRCPTLACKMLAGETALALIGAARLVNKIEIH